MPAWAQQGGRRGVVPLRPLTVGEILDGSVTTVRRYPGSLLGLGAVAAVVSAGIQILQVSNDGNDGARITVTVIGYVINAFVNVMLSGAAAVVMRSALVGDGMSGAEVLRRLRPMAGRLLATAILSTLLWLGATVLLVVPGVFFYVAVSLAGAAAALEGASPKVAIRRSRALVKGAWWRCFWILVLSAMITAVIASVLAVPALLIAGASGSLLNTDTSQLSTTGTLLIGLASAISALITAPFTSCVRALLYTDRRMRVEGLDVALRQSIAERGE